MPEKIVVGYDGTDRGRDALALARRLATATGSEVIAASVWAYEFFEMPPVIDGYRALMRQTAEQALEEARELLAEDGTSSYRELGATSPARALHELAEDEHADLVVVGSSSRGALGRVLPGSVGERLLHGAACSVAVAPAGYDAGPPRPLAPVGAGLDATPESSAALASAAALAQAVGGGVRVISAWRRPSPAHPLFAITSYGDFVADVEQAHRRRAEAALAKIGRDARCYVEEGDPAEVLVEHAAELGLLVLGSRGYGPLQRVLLGGVSGQVMQSAPCPVIVVPRGVDRPFAASLAQTGATVT